MSKLSYKNQNLTNHDILSRSRFGNGIVSCFSNFGLNHWKEAYKVSGL